MKFGGSFGYIMLRMVIAVALFALLVGVTQGRYFGDCRREVVNDFIDSMNEKVNASSDIIDRAGTVNARLLINEHTKLIEDMEALEVSSCLEESKREMVLSLTKRMHMLVAYEQGSGFLFEQAGEAADEHLQNAKDALPK